MSYIFTLNRAKIELSTSDPEEWGVAVFSGAAATAIAAELEQSYGVMGNVIDLSSVTANDIDAGLTLLEKRYSIEMTGDSTELNYPMGAEK